MTVEFVQYVAIGFLAQLVDGALGMAYGLTATSLLLGAGMSPVAASATVHAAECFTTGASAASHHALGNIDKDLFKRLLLPGILGAATGAWLLASLPADGLKPWVAGYLLLMGVVVLARGLRGMPAQLLKTKLQPLGFFGAMLDAIGGGGWGPMVTSTLLARGNELRITVGSVNAVEFFVTLTASLTFILTLGLGHGKTILALALGGLLAAPLGALLVQRVPVKPMMIAVGLLVIGLSVRTLGKHFGWF